MRRTPIILSFLITGASFVCGLWLLRPGAGEGVRESWTENQQRGEPGAPASQRAVGPTDVLPTPSPPGGPALSDDELRGRLRRVATLDLADAAAVETVLQPLAANPQMLARILFLLQGRGLARAGTGLAPEEVGALRVIAAGFSTADHAFQAAVREALVSMAQPAQGLLARCLQGEDFRAAPLQTPEDEYYALRVFDDAPENARAKLVAKMDSTSASHLLAIALTDPAASVRGQAWTRLTRAADFEPDARTLALLHEGFLNRTDGDSGLPLPAVIQAMAHLATHARSQPDLRARAVDLLRTIAADPQVSPHDREQARRLTPARARS